jgi:hypothetical protein
LVVNDGWPRALHTWKGKKKKMLLDEDKKRHLKAKEDRSMVFGLHLL